MVHPYQNQSPNTGRTMGGATIALPDSAPFILYNPANLAYATQVKLFISFFVSNSSLTNLSRNGIGIKDHKWNNNFDINSFIVSVPFHFLNRFFSVAASYNRSDPFDYRISGDRFMSYSEYSGHFQTLSGGVGVHLFSNLRVGLGWSHFFGERKLRTLFSSVNLSTKTTSGYNGDLFFLGVQQNISSKTGCKYVSRIIFR